MKTPDRRVRTWFVYKRELLGIALAVGAVAHVGAPGRVKRNMPDPVPVMVLGRLAVDKNLRGRGIGSGLLRDAVLRIIQAAEIAGIRAIVVHAISDAAKRSIRVMGSLPRRSIR